MGFWDRLKKVVRRATDVTIVSLRGHRLAVVGQTAVGKTRLLNYMLADALPAAGGYEATHTETYRLTRNRGNGHDVRLKSGTDVGGAAHLRDAHWEDACIGADAVFYLARADLILNEADPEHEAHARRIEEDVSMIETWIRRRFESNGGVLDKRFVYVATFCDQVEGYEGTQARGAPAVRDRLYQSPCVKPQIDRLKPYVRHTGFVFGSTATPAEARRLKELLIKEGAIGK
jgi:hypothetical protein